MIRDVHRRQWQMLSPEVHHDKWLCTGTVSLASLRPVPNRPSRLRGRSAAKSHSLLSVSNPTMHHLGHPRTAVRANTSLCRLRAGDYSIYHSVTAFGATRSILQPTVSHTIHGYCSVTQSARSLQYHTKCTVTAVSRKVHGYWQCHTKFTVIAASRKVHGYCSHAKCTVMAVSRKVHGC